jgi:hypothetical protein
VSASPPSGTGVVDVGGETDSELPAGDVDLVVGALTATESLADAAALDANEMVDPVLSTDAANRGRGADGVPLGAAGFMRAASWLSDGRRPAPTGFAGVSVELIVVEDEETRADVLMA